MDAARSPAELVAAMLNIVQNAPDGAVSDALRRECEALGLALMQTKGSTLLDAFAFVQITISLVNAACDALADNPELGRLHMAGGFLVRAVETLEACMDARAAPSAATSDTIH